MTYTRSPAQLLRVERRMTASRLVARYGDRHAQGHPFTEFIPPGVWVATARRLRQPTLHRVDYAAAIWFEPDRPWFCARALCRTSFAEVTFYQDVPDDIESICDDCIYADGDMPIVVYRLLGADGIPLYIGSTTNLPNRLQQHGAEQGSPWWPFVADVTYIEYTTEFEAFQAEKAAIRAEQPRYNVAHAEAGWMRRVLAERAA